jgi:hypothetical protein
LLELLVFIGLLGLKIEEELGGGEAERGKMKSLKLKAL